MMIKRYNFFAEELRRENEDGKYCIYSDIKELLIGLQIYQQYKHLDKMLSDEKLMSGDFKNKILYDLWQIIRKIYSNCNGRG